MNGSFRLRDGRICDIAPDHITVGETSWPFADLTLVQMVVDTSLPPTPGAMPPPAIALRAADAVVTVLAFENPQDAWTVLRDLHSARPDLAPPAPPPGYFPGYAYAPSDPNRPRNSSDTVLAGLSHLSVFFAPVVFPLIVWLAMRTSSPFTARHGKQAFWFHLFIGLLVGLTLGGFYAYFIFSFANPATLNLDPSSSFLPIFLIAYFVAIAIAGTLSLVQLVLSIIGAVKAFSGERWSYPLLGRL